MSTNFVLKIARKYYKDEVVRMLSNEITFLTHELEKSRHEIKELKAVQVKRASIPNDLYLSNKISKLKNDLEFWQNKALKPSNK